MEFDYTGSVAYTERQLQGHRCTIETSEKGGQVCIVHIEQGSINASTKCVCSQLMLRL